MNPSLTFSASGLDRKGEGLRRLTERLTVITTGKEVCPSVIKGLTFYRMDAPGLPDYCVYEPCVALIIQGTKHTVFGTEEVVSEPGSFFVTSIDIPTTAKVIRASAERPYLSIVLKLDMALLHDIVQSVPEVDSTIPTRCYAAGEATDELIDVFGRLVALLDRPQEIALMADLVKREVCLRLLLSDAGYWLRWIVREGYRSRGIVRAIDWLKRNYAEPLRIAELAGMAGMASSTLHHNFRQLTGTSPLQYQKTLRLHAARSLMLTERLDANTAGLRVGYESVSQFSREYARRFGAPPSRDIRQARQFGDQPAPV
ncbi:AraC family transcriptional regulator [Pseudomonas viridiflava]|nr:AraC family transcriptional regulator [Pseudomonas viridiflava]KTC22044.1 AraC family transcriptional regulator [Pseudomonas marginalis ICMP 11289]MBV1806273.1 AraC family transcriptional regulator [Pseudomonas viridiflava]MBV1816230.1 AraC family transcriptional regulator [Pseudomonas viridiflava]MCI3910601.1 AraC family transcriptional regulator [Pseudomonas viridiflava]MCQ9390737.1 AraC family transcriptional regulator [Pseudomonas viridiflava]